MSCKCTNNYSIYCISKGCINCCNNLKCLRHNLQKCKCDINFIDYDCTNKCCIDCCINSLNCKNKKHRNKLKCKKCYKKIYTIGCDKKLCIDCCNNFYCIKHKEKFKDKCIICKNRNFNINCINKKCNDCCKNTNCNEHYNICECNNINLKSECESCKKCCKNYKCYKHFLQDDDLSQEIINNYKIQLLLKNKISIELINVIIEYVDCRTICKICKYKFSLNEDCSNGVSTVCQNCHSWVCNEVYNDCSKIYNYDKYTFETYCIDCYNGDTDIEDDEDNTTI